MIPDLSDRRRRLEERGYRRRAGSGPFVKLRVGGDESEAPPERS